MRVRFLAGAFVLTLLLLGLLSTNGQAQFGFDPKDGAGLYDRMAQYQGGKDGIEIAKVQSRLDPDAKARMTAYAAKVGITNGKLTKDQFIEYWNAEGYPAYQERQKQGGGFGGFGKSPPGGGPGGEKSAGTETPQPGGFGKGGFGKGDFGKGGFGGPMGEKSASGETPQPGFGKGGFGKGGFGGPGGEKSAGTEGPGGGKGDFGKGGFGKGDFGKGGGNFGRQDTRSEEDRAKEWFGRMDRDRDGNLEDRELSEELRADMATWDTNKNGALDFDEFLPYAKQRIAARDEERKKYEEGRRGEEGKNTTPAPTSINPNFPPLPATTVIEDRKLVIIRSDNLPKDLPSWFADLDKDKDAQVGLYEWKAANKDMADFRKYDLNDDGFLTDDEVSWYVKNADRLAGLIPVNKTPATATKAPSTTTEKDKSSKDKAAEPRWGRKR